MNSGFDPTINGLPIHKTDTLGGRDTFTMLKNTQADTNDRCLWRPKPKPLEDGEDDNSWIKIKLNYNDVTQGLWHAQGHLLMHLAFVCISLVSYFLVETDFRDEKLKNAKY